ncbi:MFS transporter [Acrocarpospora catenulata]|uniref:MFS transporter n=1 Tax=Acrocarpospora catenulata TaxID=2836182 RepID=UPI001BDA6D1A|nr:MFS transporter [Acrocarpospora catenulata]
MAIEPYRRVLGLPGVRNLMILALFSRLPQTATGLVLTLHVVKTLGLSWTHAGVAGAAATVGMAVGAPLLGRWIDRRGARPVIALTTLVQLAFWVVAPALPYPALVVLAGVGGLLVLPSFGLIRQCVAAMVPKEDHRTGFALDSMATEASFMVGPALAAAGVTALSSATAMWIIAAGFVLAGTALYVLNPPTRSAEEEAADTGERVPRRRWLTARLVTVLLAAGTLTFTLTATDLAIVSTLEHRGATGWVGLVIALWCFASLIGGFVYGGLSRGLSPFMLIVALCALTVPVGLVGGGWWWLSLALVPCGLLCAPALSATVDVVNQSVPTTVRGEALGLHGTFLTIGVSAAGPVTGFIIDHAGPGWAFAGAGLVGLVLTGLAALAHQLGRAESGANLNETEPLRIV